MREWRPVPNAASNNRLERSGSTPAAQPDRWAVRARSLGNLLWEK
jgi:hypothetical protein